MVGVKRKSCRFDSARHSPKRSLTSCGETRAEVFDCIALPKVAAQHSTLGYSSPTDYERWNSQFKVVSTELEQPITATFTVE